MANNPNALRSRGGYLGQRTSGLLIPPFGAPAGAPTAVRWNSADKAAAAVLSNSDRTLTSSGASLGGARSVSSWATGKKYIELVLDATTGSGGEAVIGLATSAASLTAPNSGGSYIQAAQTSGGAANIGRFGAPTYAATITRTATWYNATAGGTGLTVPITSTLMIAADFGNGKAWFGVDGGWLGDPANGLYPAATWTGGSLTLFLWALCYDSTIQFSIPATTGFAAPAGFSVA